MEVDEVSEDELVHEVDVFVSKKLNSLYFIQYPLRPDYYNFDEVGGIEARMKPEQTKLEMTVPFDARSSCYDHRKAEQIASNCSGGIASDDATSSKSSSKQQIPFPSGRMDHQKFISANLVSSHSKAYAVGYVKDGCLHLNPVRQVLQMRPTFAYLEKTIDPPSATTKEKPMRKSHLSGDDSSQSDVEATETVRPKFAREETDADKKRREASFHYQEKLKAEEAWVPLEFRAMDCEFAQMQRSVLESVVGPSTSSRLTFSGDPDVLLRLLIPKAEEQEYSLPNLPSNVISLTQLRTLPLPEQVRALMINVKVIQFKQLISLLPPQVDIQTVLKTLQQFAVLVQGCWVIKSDILYPKDSSSAKTGISSDVLCKARDFTLYKFTHKAVVMRNEITDAIKIPHEDVYTILYQLAKYKLNKGWEFLYPFDSEFVESFPDVVERQAALWQGIISQISTTTVARHRKLSGCSVRSPQRLRHRTISKSQSSDSDMPKSPGKSGEEEQLPEKRKQNSHARHRTARSSPMSPPLAPFSLDRSSVPPRTRNYSTSSNMSVVSNAAVHNGYTSIAVPVKQEVSEKDIVLKEEFLKFLSEKLSSKPVLQLSEVKRLLLLRLTESPPGHVLTSGVSDQLIDQCALQLGCVKFQDIKMPEPIYVFSKSGDWPDVRGLIVDMLVMKQRFKFGKFKELCVEKLPYFPSDIELRRLLKEYCTQKNGMYALLGS